MEQSKGILTVPGIQQLLNCEHPVSYPAFLTSLRASGVKQLKYVIRCSGMHVVMEPTYKTKRRLCKWDSTPDQDTLLSRMIRDVWGAFHDKIIETGMPVEDGVTMIISTQSCGVHIRDCYRQNHTPISGRILFNCVCIHGERDTVNFIAIQ